MKRFTVAGGILALTLFFYSCSQFYVPNAVNVPMMKKQGDINAGIHTGTNGVDFQTSFAITDNIAVMFNGSFNHDIDSAQTDYHKHTFFEGGLGIYQTFSDYFTFETYAGVGYGEAEAYETFLLFAQKNDYLTTAKYTRPFIQFNLGIGTDFFDGGIAARFCYVKYNEIKPIDPADTNADPSSFFAEPVLFWRIGWKYIKLNSQIGFSLPFNKERFFDNQPFIFNVGISFHFNAF